MQAIWSQQVVAESDDTFIVESNHDFPMDAIQQEYFQASDSKTTCPWKGEASDFNLLVAGEVNADAAWYYPEMTEEAKHIKGMLAFWRGVEVL